MTDLINRQAAIDVVRDYYDPEDHSTESIEDRIKRLPSAQPDIVYCCDCRRYHPSFCEVWSKFGTVMTNEFDFCSRGDRRKE